MFIGCSWDFDDMFMNFPGLSRDFHGIVRVWDASMIGSNGNFRGICGSWNGLTRIFEGFDGIMMVNFEIPDLFGMKA